MRYGLVGSTGRMGQEIQKAFVDHTLCLTVTTKEAGAMVANPTS